jgi:hypothetical protein
MALRGKAPYCLPPQENDQVVLRKTAIALAAAVMAARLGGPAEASFRNSQLDKIEDIIDSGSWVELRDFIEANPALLRGNDSLAVLLREFMLAVDSLYTWITFEPAMFPDLAEVNRNQALY